MSHPLIEALLQLEAVTPVCASSMDAYLDENFAGLTLLFFTGDPEKKLETADVAVVLREFLNFYEGRVRVGIIDRADEAALMGRAAVLMLPSISIFAGPRHLETIPKIQDWSVYAEKLPALLAQTEEREDA